MAYQKGDEKGYFTKVLAILALIALIMSVFAYAAAGVGNSSIEKEIEVGNQEGVVTVDPSGNGPFPSAPPESAPPESAPQ